MKQLKRIIEARSLVPLVGIVIGALAVAGCGGGEPLKAELTPDEICADRVGPSKRYCEEGAGVALEVRGGYEAAVDEPSPRVTQLDYKVASDLVRSPKDRKSLARVCAFGLSEEQFVKAFKDTGISKAIAESGGRATRVLELLYLLCASPNHSPSARE